MSSALQNFISQHKTKMSDRTIRELIDFNEVMRNAAGEGHIELVKLCKEFGATDFNYAIENAAKNGHIDIVKLCKEYGATDFDDAMANAAGNDHIVAVLRGFRGFDVVHDDLLQYHHKRQFYTKIYNEVLSVAWHPSRWWDWCMPEDEKKEISKLWS